MANEVFISYSRRNYGQVYKIKEEIDRKVGIDCWMDIDGIESGEQFLKVIASAINRHDTFLFMLSKESMQSEYALGELGLAKKNKKRVILVNIDSSEMIDEFYMMYHKYDNILWSDPLQHDKLLRNLKSWFHKEKEKVEEEAQTKIKEFDKVVAQERDDEKAKAWNVLHSWCPEDVEKYGISIFSFVPGKKLTVYYRGYTFECQEEIAMIKNFLDIKRISNLIAEKGGRGFFEVKDYIRKDFETYCKENSNILANAENMITFCSESDYLRLLRMQNRRHIHIHRIAQEMQLIPLCYDPNKELVYSIEYQNLYCDAASGGGVPEILQAGFLGGHRYNLKDLDYSASITHKLSAFEGFTDLVLGGIVMYEILTKRYEENTVLLTVFPFDVNAEIWVNGRCRDNLRFFKKYHPQTIPMKSSELIIDDNCSSVILSLLGKRFAFDIPKLFGYVPKSFEITFDVDANLIIKFTLKDKDSNKEISIRQEELLDYEERGW